MEGNSLTQQISTYCLGSLPGQAIHALPVLTAELSQLQSIESDLANSASLPSNASVDCLQQLFELAKDNCSKQTEGLPNLASSSELQAMRASDLMADIVLQAMQKSQYKETSKSPKDSTNGSNAMEKASTVQNAADPKTTDPVTKKTRKTKAQVKAEPSNATLQDTTAHKDPESNKKRGRGRPKAKAPSEGDSAAVKPEPRQTRPIETKDEQPDTTHTEAESVKSEPAPTKRKAAKQQKRTDPVAQPVKGELVPEQTSSVSEPVKSEQLPSKRKAVEQSKWKKRQKTAVESAPQVDQLAGEEEQNRQKDIISSFVEQFGGQGHEIPYQGTVKEPGWEELIHSVVILGNVGVLKDCKSELESLLTLSEREVEQGCTLSLFRDGVSFTYDQENALKKGLSACLTALHILTIKDVSRQMIRDDTVALVLKFLKQVLMENVLPLEDESFRNRDAGGKKAKPKKPKTQKKAAKEEEMEPPPDMDEEMMEEEHEDAHVKEEKQQQKIEGKLWASAKARLQWVPSQVQKLLERFALFIKMEKTSDKYLYEALDLSKQLLELEVNPGLQQSAGEIFLSVFVNCEPKRKEILRDLSEILRKIDHSKKHLRKFELSHLGPSVEVPKRPSETGQSTSIQVITSIILRLLQGLLEVEAPKDEKEQEAFLCSMKDKLKNAQMLATWFVHIFMESLVPQHGPTAVTISNPRIKAVLSNMTKDLFTVLYLPEWPAAEFLLWAFALKLNKIAKMKVDVRQGPQSYLRLLSIDLLGDICAEVKWHGMQSKRCGLALRARQKRVDQDGQPQKKGEVVDCPCGEQREAAEDGEDDHEMKVDMGPYLDCDDCHVWFHMRCVGLMEEESVPEKWFCGPCTLRREIENQKQQLGIDTETQTSQSQLATQDEGGTGDKEGTDLGLTSKPEVILHLCLNYFTQKSEGDALMLSARKCFLAHLLDENYQLKSAEEKSEEERIREEERKAKDAQMKKSTGKKGKKKKMSKKEMEQLKAEAEAEEQRRQVLLESPQLSNLAKWLLGEWSPQHKFLQNGPGLAKMEVLCVSRDTMLHLYRETVKKRVLFKRIDDIYQLLMRNFDEPQPAVRTKVMRAMTAVVKVDSSVLRDKEAQRNIVARLWDTSKAVRAEALELVGDAIIREADLFPLYYSNILKKTEDVGVSVRKRAIKILRDICLKQEEPEEYVQICVAILKRIDDEETVSNFVLSSFETMWFSDELLQDRVVGVNGHIKQFSDRFRQLVERIVKVVGALPNSQTFVQIIRYLIDKEDEDAEGKTKKKKKQDKKLVRIWDICTDMSYCIVNQLLNCEGDRGAKLPCYVAALHCFCQVSPHFLVEHAEALLPLFQERGLVPQDKRSFVQAKKDEINKLLMVYKQASVDIRTAQDKAPLQQRIKEASAKVTTLKKELEPFDDSEVQFIERISEMFSEILPHLRKPSPELVKSLERELMSLIDNPRMSNRHYHSYIMFAIPTLCILTAAVTENVDKLFSLAQKQCDYILEKKAELAKDRSNTKLIPHVSLAVLALGLLIRHFDFDPYVKKTGKTLYSTHKKSQGNANFVFDLYKSLYDLQNPGALEKCLFQAMIFIFSRAPELTTDARKILDSSLAFNAKPDIQLNTIKQLVSFLQFESKRTKKLQTQQRLEELAFKALKQEDGHERAGKPSWHRSTSIFEKQKQIGDYLPQLNRMVEPAIHKLAMSQHNAVRQHTLIYINVVLQQNITNPAAAVIPLVMCLTDLDDSCRHKAADMLTWLYDSKGHRLLVFQHFIPGFLKSFVFQRLLASNSFVFQRLLASNADSSQKFALLSADTKPPVPMHGLDDVLSKICSKPPDSRILCKDLVEKCLSVATVQWFKQHAEEAGTSSSSLASISSATSDQTSATSADAPADSPNQSSSSSSDSSSSSSSSSAAAPAASPAAAAAPTSSTPVAEVFRPSLPAKIQPSPTAKNLERQLQSLAYFARIIAAHPFENDEPLRLVYHLGRCINREGAELEESMTANFECIRGMSDLQDPLAGKLLAVLQQQAHAALCTSILLKLKAHLEELYYLNDKKYESWRPNQTVQPGKAVIKVTRDTQMTDLKLDLPFDADATKEKKNKGTFQVRTTGRNAKKKEVQEVSPFVQKYPVLVAQYTVFKELMDEDDLKFASEGFKERRKKKAKTVDPEGKKAKKPPAKKKPKKRKKAEVDSDEEEEEDYTATTSAPATAPARTTGRVRKKVDRAEFVQVQDDAELGD
eukprot:g25246.t1